MILLTQLDNTEDTILKLRQVGIGSDRIAAI